MQVVTNKENGLKITLKNEYSEYDLKIIKQIYSPDNAAFNTRLKEHKDRLVHLYVKKSNYDSYQIVGSVVIQEEDKQLLDSIFFPESSFGPLYKKLTFYPEAHKVLLSVGDIDIEIDFKDLEIHDLVKIVQSKYNTLNLLCLV